MTPAEPRLADHSVVVNRVCHMIVLSKEGKVEDAADNLVLAVIAADPTLRLLRPKDFADALSAYFSVHLPESLLRDSLDRTEWFESFPEHLRPLIAPSGQALWRALVRYLAKAFLRHGAQTARLISPDVNSPTNNGPIAFLTDAIRECCPGMPEDLTQDALLQFFRFDSPSRSRYLAQLLDGTFTLFALSVDEATARFLRSKLSPLKIFLDTNFIFGILGLHNNQFVEASRELIAVFRSPGLPFKLYYHEETLHEIERTFEEIGGRLRSQAWQPAISRAAVASGQLTGIELLFHQKNGESPIDADLFLARFGDIKKALAEFGAVIYVSLGPTKDETYEKSLQIAEYEDYLKHRRPDRPRHYAAMNHDIVVWREVQRIRARSASSVLEAGALFLSADASFYTFDWNQLRPKASAGTVVLPNLLLQLLRPFIASTDDFDRRFVETFAIPEMRALPADYGSTTSKIVAHLNSISGMSEEAALKLLTNKMLLDSLRQQDERSVKFAQTIDDALAREHEALAKERDLIKAETEKIKRRVGELEGTTQQKNQELKAATEAHNAATEQIRQSKRETAEALQTAASAKEEYEQRLKDQESRLNDFIIQNNRRGERRRNAITCVGTLLSVLVAVGIFAVPENVAHWSWLANHPNRLTIYCGSFLAWISLCWLIAERDKVRRWAAAFLLLGGSVLAVVQALGK